MPVCTIISYSQELGVRNISSIFFMDYMNWSLNSFEYEEAL